MTNAEEKQYQCSQCDKDFSVKSKLNMELLAHTGEKKKPYI